MKSHEVVVAKCFLAAYYPILFRKKCLWGLELLGRDLNHIKDWHDVTKVTLSCTTFEFLKVPLFIRLLPL